MPGLILGFSVYVDCSCIQELEKRYEGGLPRLDPLECLVWSGPFFSGFLSVHVGWCVQELEKRYEGGLPRLDPVEDMNIAEPAVNSAVRRIEQLEQQLAANEVFKVNCLCQSNAWCPLRYCSKQGCLFCDDV